MRKQNSDFEARFISEEGSRLKNRDYFGYVELDETISFDFGFYTCI